MSSGEARLLHICNMACACVCVFRANNRIAGISAEQLEPFLSLETLDLSNNVMGDIRASSFPPLSLKNL